MLAEMDYLWIAIVSMISSIIVAMFVVVFMQDRFNKYTQEMFDTKESLVSQSNDMLNWGKTLKADIKNSIKSAENTFSGIANSFSGETGLVGLAKTLGPKLLEYMEKNAAKSSEPSQLPQQKYTMDQLEEAERTYKEQLELIKEAKKQAKVKG